MDRILFMDCVRAQIPLQLSESDWAKGGVTGVSPFHPSPIHLLAP